MKQIIKLSRLRFVRVLFTTVFFLGAFTAVQVTANNESCSCCDKVLDSCTCDSAGCETRCHCTVEGHNHDVRNCGCSACKCDQCDEFGICVVCVPGTSCTCGTYCSLCPGSGFCCEKNGHIFANCNCTGQMCFCGGGSCTAHCDCDAGLPSFGWTESALSQGRKISLSGMPMPDVAQHKEGESDYSPESTHVDALTLNLVHDTTDIHVPVGTDQFALEVRRTLTQEIWRDYTSLSPEEYADKPFGPCWKSTICPSVHLSTTAYNTKYSITDHMGRSYSFERCPTGFNDDQEPVDYEQYKDLSRTQSALSMQGVTFEYEGIYDAPDKATLTLPNDTVLDYILISSTERTIYMTVHKFCRLEKVTDRYGNTLIYDYDGDDSIIPTSIASLATGQALVITVEPVAADGNNVDRITKITDPKGNEIIYEYDGGGMLEAVKRPGNSTTTYTYDESSEADDDDTDLFIDDYQHLTIESITDANGNAYSFTFTDPERYYYYPEISRNPKCGNPRILETIDFPDGASSVSFAEYEDSGDNKSGIYNTHTNINDTWQYVLLGTRKNFITDINSHEWTYYFSDPVGCDPGDYRRDVWTFEYGHLTITAPGNSGTEEYHFGRLMDGMDGVKIMALDSSVSYSGATTEYAYDHFSDGPGAWESCAKPSVEINALEQSKSYTYTTENNFQLETVVDELGRETVYEFGFIGENNDVANVGKRTRMTVLEPVDGLILSETEFRYDNPDYKNFMTGKIVKKRAGTGWVAQDEPEPASWVADLVTEYERHARGKVAKQIIYPNGITSAGLTTIYDYDLNNNLTSVIDPRGNETVNEYDDFNRLKIISFYEGSAVSGVFKCSKEFWYDLRSNKTWERDERDPSASGEDHYTYFEYDEYNRVKKTVRIMDYTLFTAPTTGRETYTPPDPNPLLDIVTTSEYNPDGTLEYTIDPRGMRTEYEYDALRRLTDVNVDVAYAGRPSILGDLLAYNTHYDYDGVNSGAITLPPYKFSPTKVTDPRGYSIKSEYDALSRPIETWADDNEDPNAYNFTLLAEMKYDDVGNLEESKAWVSHAEDGGVDRLQITETLYDDLNRPEKVTSNPNSTDNQRQEVRMYYTSTGLQWKTIVENGDYDRVSTVQYDAVGRPTITTSPGVVLVEGGPTEYATTETEYDANGNVEFVTDAEDNITEYTYDYRNRLLDTIAPEVADWGLGGNGTMTHPTVSAEYDDVGNATAVTDAEGNKTEYFFDANNRMWKSVAPQVNVYVDATSSSPLRPVTINEYDENGNITATIDANNTQLAPAAQKKIEMQYDALGRLKKTIDAISNTIEFEYDANGNQRFLIDGNGNSTEFVYDGLNRKTSTIYPAVGAAPATHEEAEYDLVGNRIKRTDCNQTATVGDGDYTEYEYDLLNRLVLVTYLDGDVTTTDRTRDYVYDNLGNLLSVDESGTTDGDVSYTYDTLNRVETETSVGVTHTYQYDLNGNRRWAKYDVTDREVVWTYDALNRITTISTDLTGSTALTSYAYDLNSKPVYREYPSSVTEERTFDAMGRLLTMTTSEDTDEMLIATYHYDAVGSALWMGQTAPGETIGGVSIGDHETKWEYDDRYRLTDETVDDARTEYAWDDADNRLSKTEYAACGDRTSLITYTPNALNQMTGYTIDTATEGDAPEIWTVVGYAYDANGARTNKTVTVDGDSTAITYTYDEDNRLVEAVESTVDAEGNHTLTGSGSTFAYDYRSRRYFRDVSGGSNPETTYHVFDGGLSVQEYDVPPASSGQPTVEFIRGEGMGGGVGGMVYSIKDDGSGNDEIICSHANHRGDIIARSDSSGSLTSFALYEAYGTRPYEWGTDPDRQKANTKEEESDLGLLNEGMRFRDLETGTFLTRDPIGYADGPNVYCYVHCNPITRFDAWGLITVAFYHGADGGGYGMGGNLAKGAHFQMAAESGNYGAVRNVSSAAEANAILKELVESGETIDSVSIFDHGSIGNQQLGDRHISGEEIAEMGGYIKPDGTIILHGCNVAKGDEGEKRLQNMANTSQRRVQGETVIVDYSGKGVMTRRGGGKPIDRSSQGDFIKHDGGPAYYIGDTPSISSSARDAYKQADYFRGRMNRRNLFRPIMGQERWDSGGWGMPERWEDFSEPAPGEFGDDGEGDLDSDLRENSEE